MYTLAQCTYFIHSAIHNAHTLYILLYILHILYTFCYTYCTYFIHSAIHTPHTLYILLYILHILYTFCYTYSAYFIHSAIHTPHTLYILLYIPCMYNLHWNTNSCPCNMYIFIIRSIIIQPISLIT